MDSPKPEDAILDAALARPAAERDAFVARACGGDARLAEIVRAMLRAYAQAPVGAAPVPVSAGRTVRLPLAAAEQPGDWIGPYKILQPVGEGGCGVVYLAEQQAPVRRRVALKLIKLGMDTRQVIARFEAERQALAMMDHPNIARVLDAGATNAGRPYFVMELVRGIRITDYCDQQQLTTEARLRLFGQVCRAVQHAHQKGIIHRDLKPSNILVTLHDGVPVPKVIDFGIAKAIEQRLTDLTLFTALEQFIGTPAYMSPEQAEMSGLDIDTRSDIYSLGVLLYELLTGRVPFDARELAAAGLDEIRRIIREKNPVRPSTRISSLEAVEQTTVARCRQVEPPRLIHLVRGDLDWIVMKCLEKDRTRRYETANGLARDVERFLGSEPIVARPPSSLYRFQKLVHRHQLGVGAAVAVLASLVLGLGLASWQFVGKNRAYQRAKKEASKSEQAFNLLASTLAGVDPAVACGMDTKLLTMILTNAAGRVGRELTNQPELEATVRLVLGKAFHSIGRFSNALAQSSEAARLGKAGFGAASEPVSDALAEIGSTLWDLGDFGSAEKIGREALELRRKVLTNEHPKIATSLNNVGLALFNQERFDPAGQMWREALRIREKVLPPDHSDLAQSFGNLAQLDYMLGDLDRAEANSRRALEIQRRISGEKHPVFATAQNNLATFLSRRGSLEEARDLHERTLALRREIYPPDHALIASSLSSLGMQIGALGDPDSGREKLEAALAMEARLGMVNHPFVGYSLLNLGTLQMKQGDFGAAETNLLRALNIQRRGDTNAESTDIADVLDGLGLIRAANGEDQEAARLFRDEQNMNRKSLPANHPDLIPALAHLSWARRRLGDLPGAESLRRQCLEIARQRGVAGAHSFTTALCDLAEVLQARGQSGAAEQLVLEALQFCQADDVTASPVHRHVLQRGVRFYEAWDKTEPPAGKAATALDWRQKLARLESDHR